MAFKGWPAEALEFFEGLEADNSKAYWQDHREVYANAVRGPMDALLGELEREFGAGAVFRPYRDVRFSADKSPYKTQLGARVGNGGYVQLSAEGLAAGCGLYAPEREALARFRAAVADDRAGGELESIVAALRKKSIEVTASEVLRTAPRGVPRDHPRIELLRHKGLVTWKTWPAAAWLGTAAAKQRVVGFLRASRPLAEWLCTHVGDAMADGA